MRINRLKNYFRKFKANYISREVLEEVLEDSISGLSSHTKEFDKNKTQLRKFEGDKMAIIEAALFSAHRYLARQEYESVIKELAKGKKTRSKMIEAIETIGVYNAASEQQKQIEEMIDQQLLKQLPVFAIIRGQLERVASSIKNNKYFEAKTLLKYVIGDINQVNTTAYNEQELEKITSKFNCLKQVYLDTKHLSQHCKEKQQYNISGKVELLINYLVEERNFQLVHKILSDIEIAMANRILFRDILFKTNQELNNQLLERSLQENSWVGGSNYLLQLDMQKIKKEVEAINSKSKIA